MPWKAFKRNDEWCVYRIDDDGKPFGKTLGCHPTRAAANKQVAALYVHEPQARVKALGDWELEVLGLPYGGPQNGRDAQGEYFTPETRFHEDKYGLPPVVYYHGFTPDGQPDGDPKYIGKTVARERRSDGVWFRVVLDKTNEFARRVWDAAKRGLARASSGALAHLVRKDEDGRIVEWPVGELSLFDADEGRRPANAYAVALPVMKAVYEEAGLQLPDPDDIEAAPEAEPEADNSAATAEACGDEQSENDSGEIAMDEKEIKAQINDAVKAALEAYEKRQKERAEAEAKRAEELRAAAEEAVKAARAEWEEEAKKANRLPYLDGEAPYQTKYGTLNRYDNLNAADTAFLIGTLKAHSRRGGCNPPSEDAYRALAVKAEAEIKNEQYDPEMDLRPATKALHALSLKAGHEIKSDEIMQHDLSNYGDEWVGVYYSNQLWESIRTGTFAVQKLPKVEVPPGHDSIVIPLESTDPTFYKVSEAADITDTTTGLPDATVTASQMGTANKTLSLGKMGARVLFSGELNEDSLIPFVPQLRQQLQRAGAEQLEHVVIDGDTTTSASTNINDIAGTPAGTEAFLLVDGFRVLPLIDNTANSRSAGTLTEEDFLETVKLLGTAGKSAADIARVGLICDPNTYWKALALSTVKTQDVWRQATLEGGRLRQIWGYELLPSWQMHYKSADRKANTSGCIDQDTTTNNTTGAILAVRWDQWMFGWRRRMTMETQRIARADTTEIVCLMRFGLVYRDTEASAISYNVTL